MAYEQRDNSGSVFENDRKESDNHPDYTGKAMIGGVMYWVSMWVKEKQGGEEFFSLSVKPQDEQQRQAPQRQQEAPQRQSRRVAPQGQAPQRQQPQRQQRQAAPNGFDDMDDDIPY